MSIPIANPAGNAAPALELLAAAGNALSPGHTPDSPTGPATGAGFLALVQQALGVQQPAAGCPAPDAPTDASPDVEPVVAQPGGSEATDPKTEPHPTAGAPTTAPPTVLDPIYAALVANFSPLPASLPSPMTAPAVATTKTSAPVLTLVKAEGAPDGQAVAAAAQSIGDAKRAEKAGQTPPPQVAIGPTAPAEAEQAQATTGTSASTTSAVDDSSISTSSTSGTTSGSTSGGSLPHDTSSPSPETQRRAGTDGGEPAAAVDGSGTRGARNERNGWLAAAGFPAAGPEGRGTSAPAENTQLPQAVASVGPVQAAGQVTPASEAAAPNPITTQVVDRIASLTSQNGTHRITLDLTPGDLGQIRVVMTVRDGAVHVRLAAGERDTRSALLEGSAELKSLLGAAGATDTKITIRELGNAFGTQLQNQSQNPDSQAQHQAPGQGWGNQDQHAGTRATYEPATDGTTTSHRDSGAGATGTRSSETVSSNRNPGLDVTM